MASRRTASLLACTWLLCTVPPHLQAEPALHERSAASPSQPTVQSLNRLSAGLIARLQTGNAEAPAFRTQAVFYRESLRGLMLANEQRGAHRLPKPALMQMVRMAALLQSAAECQTGRYITCPASLMRALVQQQKAVSAVPADTVAARP